MQTVLRRKKTCTIHNVADRLKTVILEHPFESRRQPVGMEPLARTTAACRFEDELERMIESLAF